MVVGFVMVFWIGGFVFLVVIKSECSLKSRSCSYVYPRDITSFFFQYSKVHIFS